MALELLAEGHAAALESSIAPHTPEQTGIIERYFRTLKEECVWLHTFTDFTYVRREVIA